MTYSGFIDNDTATFKLYGSHDVNGKPVISSTQTARCFYQQRFKILHVKDGQNIMQKGYICLRVDIVNVNNYSDYEVVIGTATFKIQSIDRIVDTNGNHCYTKLVLI